MFNTFAFKFTSSTKNWLRFQQIENCHKQLEKNENHFKRDEKSYNGQRSNSQKEIYDKCEPDTRCGFFAVNPIPQKILIPK